MKLEVLTSGIWQTNSAVISHGGACLVTDPAYFPRELAAIAERAQALGGASAVAFTHGHWDHVMGHTACPGAPVWMHEGLLQEIEGDTARAARYLADAREFDSRWYVPRPHGHRWPAQRRGVADGQVLDLGGAQLLALHLPGHSPDGLGLWLDPVGVLLCGDYLSPCEIPFIDDPARYAGTLRRLLALIEHQRGEVVPGHGPRLTAAEAAAIARADLAYVEALQAAAARSDRAALLDTPWPRAREVVGMREAHLENCDKLLAPGAPA